MTRDGVLKGPPLPDLGRGIAGAICAAASTAALYPLSLIATRSKLATSHEVKQKDENGKGAADTDIARVAREIYSSEGGLKAFYAGVVEAAGKAFADVILFFVIYGFIRRRLGARGVRGSSGLGIVEKLLFGVVPEVLTKVLTAPIETILTRKQASGKSIGVKEVVEQIVRERGIRGLWAGYSLSLLLAVNPLVAFTLDEKLGGSSTSGSSQQTSRVLTPMLTKLLATSLTYPLLVAKTRIQAADYEFPKPSSWMDALSGTVRTGMPGFTPSVLSESLHHGITVLAKSAVYTWTTRAYYTYLVFSDQYHFLLDKAKKEIEDLAEGAKQEAAQMAAETVKEGKKVMKVTAEDIYSDETADLVADYVEDEAEQWKSLYRWFSDKEKKRHGE